MKLEDIKIGEKFVYNNKEYLRIDVDLLKMFANGSAYNRTIRALDMETFKVICFNQSTEINEK